jgi:hypothetical protein
MPDVNKQGDEAILPWAGRIKHVYGKRSHAGEYKNSQVLKVPHLTKAQNHYQKT